MRFVLLSREFLSNMANKCGTKSLGRLRVLLNVANARDICVPIGNSFY